MHKLHSAFVKEFALYCIQLNIIAAKNTYMDSFMVEHAL